MHEKTTCQFQIKFITHDFLQMYKTLQLLSNIFTSIKLIENAYVPQTKVIKNAKRIKAWIKLKLFIVLSLMK